MPESFSWFMYVPAIGQDHDRVAMAHSWLVVVLLVLMALVARAKMKRISADSSIDDLVPESRLTMRNFFDFYSEKILGMMQGLMGDEAPRYFWLIGTIFIYIFLSNLLGLIPGLLPPTENINTNLAVSIIVFFAYNAIGVKAHGAGYVKHFLGPVVWLAPLMLILEVISHLARPMTLAVRLFGNINGDHILLGIFSQLLPDVATPVIGLLIPCIFLGLGMFVAFVQALVFSLLSVVYISLAVAEEH